MSVGEITVIMPLEGGRRTCVDQEGGRRTYVDQECGRQECVDQVCGYQEDRRLDQVLEYALSGINCRFLYTVEEIESYFLRRRTDKGSERILFAVALGKTGINLEYYKLLRYLRSSENVLEGFTGAVLTDAQGALYTKSVARELVFTANMAGCAFVGKPLVEGTETLDNFAIVAGNMDTDYYTAYKKSARLLVEMLMGFEPAPHEQPKLLALHASSHETSNTFAIWNEVKKGLGDFKITEIGLRNGTLSDCAGCPYKMCLHFGEKGSCFYGGVMTDDVYPAVRETDAIVMLCPNYNDALSANLTAFINRLTALFRTTRFYDKALFAIVVSGYSGSDIVAEQLVAALNMNKTFYLPGHFTMLETANNAGAALKLPGIEHRISEFTKNIRSVVKK